MITNVKAPVKDVVVPCGQSQPQLLEQVLVQFKELREGIEDLAEETFLYDRFSVLMSCFRHCITKVLLGKTIEQILAD